MKKHYIKCNKNPPHLLLLDINLPKAGVVEVTKQLIGKEQCSILLTTSDIGLNAPKIFEAMGYGAIDVVSLKSYNFDEDLRLLENFIKKVNSISLLLGRHVRIRNKAQKQKSPPTTRDAALPSIIVIGASTGGPFALSKNDFNFSCFSKLHRCDYSAY